MLTRVTTDKLTCMHVWYLLIQQGGDTAETSG